MNRKLADGAAETEIKCHADDYDDEDGDGRDDEGPFQVFVPQLALYCLCALLKLLAALGDGI